METIQIVRKCMLYIDWQPSIEAFRVGIFSLKWYSLLWMFGLMIAYMIVKHLYKQQGVPEEKFYPQFFYCFIGVLAGARLGHCIFYQPDYFLTSGKGIIEMFLPIHIQDNGSWSYIGYRGLASHGGTIGLFVALAFYWRKENLKPMMVLDNVAIAEEIVGCIGAECLNALVLQLFNGWNDDFLLLFAQSAVFAASGIEREHGNARTRDAHVAA